MLLPCLFLFFDQTVFLLFMYRVWKGLWRVLNIIFPGYGGILNTFLAASDHCPREIQMNLPLQIGADLMSSWLKILAQKLLNRGEETSVRRNCLLSVWWNPVSYKEDRLQEMKGMSCKLFLLDSLSCFKYHDPSFGTFKMQQLLPATCECTVAGSFHWQVKNQIGTYLFFFYYYK